MHQDGIIAPSAIIIGGIAKRTVSMFKATIQDVFIIPMLNMWGLRKNTAFVQDADIKGGHPNERVNCARDYRWT